MTFRKSRGAAPGVALATGTHTTLVAQTITMRAEGRVLANRLACAGAASMEVCHG